MEEAYHPASLEILFYPTWSATHPKLALSIYYFIERFNLHTLLVVTTRNLEQIALEFITKGISWDLNPSGSDMNQYTPSSSRLGLLLLVHEVVRRCALPFPCASP